MVFEYKQNFTKSSLVLEFTESWRIPRNSKFYDKKKWSSLVLVFGFFIILLHEGPFCAATDCPYFGLRVTHQMGFKARVVVGIYRNLDGAPGWVGASIKTLLHNIFTRSGRSGGQTPSFEFQKKSSITLHFSYIGHLISYHGLFKNALKVPWRIQGRPWHATLLASQFLLTKSFFKT